jgi:hypothetical protein
MTHVTDNPVWDGVEVRVVDVRRALADQTESVQRYVFGVPEGRLEALRARFPKDSPEQLFERALNEDQSALFKHVLHGLEAPYRFVFSGARCTLPSPRPDADGITPAGIRLWEEKPGFKMGDSVASQLQAIPPRFLPG